MKRMPGCCGRQFTGGHHGLCVGCVRKMRALRKEHTLQSAFAVADEEVEQNVVGVTRLLAWALRREVPFASDLRFEQGPAACAALLRP